MYLTPLHLISLGLCSATRHHGYGYGHSDLTWSASNGAVLPAAPPTDSAFSILAPPATDLWRPDDLPGSDNFTAPYITTSVQVGKFKSLKATVNVPWRTQFDQGGLLVIMPLSAAEKAAGVKTRWVKGGIEYFEEAPALGVVGTDRFSDWSLAPMPAPPQSQTAATFEAVKNDTTLFIYVVVDGQQQALREVRWAFVGVDEEAELEVGVYAAKPTFDEGSDAGIEVTFSDLVVETC
ncbi:hypothetical protein LTR15_010907 [Elasticomyces elasticus]|nr:hypothetical protein LTR15_010907 [Elasticomyces elasticus]